MNRNNCELDQTTSNLGYLKLGCSINIKDTEQLSELVVNSEAFLFAYFEPPHRWGAGAGVDVAVNCIIGVL